MLLPLVGHGAFQSLRSETALLADMSEPSMQRPQMPREVI